VHLQAPETYPVVRQFGKVHDKQVAPVQTNPMSHTKQVHCPNT